MKEILKAAMLFDFYGELLTEKQKSIFELFYLNDLSLTEIGQELNISRQAVRDQLKRTEKILSEYEEKLMLVERFYHQKKLVKKIKSIIEKIEHENILSSVTASEIEEIKNIIDEIID